MRQEFKLQDPGEGVREVEINEILVSKGDQVSEGDDLFVVESDKAAIELPSPYSGRVAEIKVSEGDTAEVGDVLMVIEDEAEGEEETEPEEEADGEPEEEKAKSERKEEVAGEEEAEEEEEKPKKERERRERKAERQEEEKREKRKKAEREKQPEEAEDKEEPIRAAPAARKLAKEEGVDLADVEPTGSKGQITLDDIRAAVEEPEEKKATEEAPPVEAEEERDEFGPVERTKLRSIRAATARAMARSWAEIPHVTHEEMADITELERWRREQVKAEGDETLTLTPFILKAATAILRRHPRFNARLDSESGEIELKKYYNLNVAVATERGLMTPVIRDVDRKPVRELAHELAELTERMHKGKASKQDLQGGTFTVTNVGGLGGTSFAPIINPPQTAILGCARARLMPVVVDGDVENLDAARTETRLMLPLVLAFDHRVLDGADAARFANEVAGLLGDVKAFALDV